MSKKVCVSLTVVVSPICLALGLLAVPRIAYFLLGLNFVGLPVSLILVGSFFIAGGVLFLLRDPLTGLTIN